MGRWDAGARPAGCLLHAPLGSPYSWTRLCVRCAPVGTCVAPLEPRSHLVGLLRGTPNCRLRTLTKRCPSTAVVLPPRIPRPWMPDASCAALLSRLPTQLARTRTRHLGTLHAAADMYQSMPAAAVAPALQAEKPMTTPLGSLSGTSAPSFVKSLACVSPCSGRLSPKVRVEDAEHLGFRCAILRLIRQCAIGQGDGIGVHRSEAAV